MGFASRIVSLNLISFFFISINRGLHIFCTCVFRSVAAGRGVCAAVAVRLCGLNGADLGGRQHASGGLQQLHLL